jgi:hypothetical protein
VGVTVQEIKRLYYSVGSADLVCYQPYLAPSYLITLRRDNIYITIILEDFINFLTLLHSLPYLVI